MDVITEAAMAGAVEKILKEQLLELGIDAKTLAPEDIAANMSCDVWPDQTMIYAWKEQPIVRVSPKMAEQGILGWKIFTHDDVAKQ